MVAASKPARREAWAPDRQQVIWIDCNPQTGREMNDVHPFLVLSPRTFNARTSLVIGLPMTTVEYNADDPFAVAIGLAKGRGKTYVLCHQPKSFDWRILASKAHPLRALPTQEPYLLASSRQALQTMRITGAAFQAESIHANPAGPLSHTPVSAYRTLHGRYLHLANSESRPL